MITHRRLALAAMAGFAALALQSAPQAGMLELPVPPAAPSSGFTLVNTPVDQMAPQTAQAYMISIQEELIAHGYRPGPVDGKMGPQTRSAIRAYQRDAGLTVDGIATKELLDHLKFAQPKVYASTSTSSPALDPALVRDIQVELAERGYYYGELDGIAGSGTRQGVRDFQSDAKLPVTGEIDQALLEQLRKASPDIRASSSI